jgi:hypothetical protein
MDNPEKLTKWGTQDEEKQNNTITLLVKYQIEVIVLLAALYIYPKHPLGP